MSLSIYVHIPYCLQRCRYCDFATFELGTVIEPKQYIDLVLKEIRSHSASVLKEFDTIKTIYFGGGTPSLMTAEYLALIISEFQKVGFKVSSDCETTMEINPSTQFDQKIDQYLLSGFNRFSVGAQTFNEDHLSSCGRKHTAKETIQTLETLKNKNLNYSLDILFALPHQTMDEFLFDLDCALSFNPRHVSPYCLTVPDYHSMAKNRPLDEVQVEMFEVMHRRLEENGLHQYEISNYSNTHFESKHNIAYWTNQAYWGLGLSSHSYFPKQRLRFWNPKSINKYEEQILSSSNKKFSLNNLAGAYPKDQFEYLKDHEFITDFCHTFLRLKSGLNIDTLRSELNNTQFQIVKKKLDQQVQPGRLQFANNHWALTEAGKVISNQIFSEILCVASDFDR